MEGFGYILTIFLVGAFLFTSAVIALYWASKNGQFKDFEENAKTIFDAEEPEGLEGDSFPDNKKKD